MLYCLAAVSDTHLQRVVNAIRSLSAEAVQKAKSGHPGMPMGMADIATALWTRHLRFNPQEMCIRDSGWPAHWLMPMRSFVMPARVLPGRPKRL